MIFKNILFRKRLYVSLFVLMYMYSAFAQEKKENLDHLTSQYHQDVIGVSNNGIVEGRDAMKIFLDKFYDHHGSSADYKTHYTVPVYKVLEYEIGSFKTKKGKQFAEMIIWTKGEGSKQKIAEILYEKTLNSKEIPVELSKSREKWMRLCNQHNAEKLVSELYTEDAIYYNRGRLLTGHDQLTKEYGYMNSPTYQLQLSPSHIEIVTEDIIFEIGQCSGTYNLPYVLVWKKQQDSDWKIYLDSNY